MLPECEPGLLGSGAHAPDHVPAVSVGLCSLGHIQDLAGTGGGLGLRRDLAVSVLTAAAGGSGYPFLPPLLKNHV